MFKKKKKKNELKSHHSCRAINIYGSKKGLMVNFLCLIFLYNTRETWTKAMIYWRTTEAVNGERIEAAAGELKTITLDDNKKKNPPAAPAVSVWAADCASLVTSRIFNLRVMLRSVGLSLFVAARRVLPGILLINYRHQEKKSNSSQTLKSTELKKQSGPLLNPTANGVK